MVGAGGLNSLTKQARVSSDGRPGGEKRRAGISGSGYFPTAQAKLIAIALARALLLTVHFSTTLSNKIAN
jgi:hypothetical protein